ncbi:hypothetical protein LV82_00779 [Albidovulum inexpectatum]|uniref:Uncharacterized protein n=1 Tax=Albidovulum inexpectatum TaxID=196587 RepID=A0A2S5JJD3_9RHOB|nr:hypothetical protein [Albidovulum inexpectatum]PPB81570.1 hypothetical protein LV82_00779 [Albidovulum inexpectatum]
MSFLDTSGSQGDRPGLWPLGLVILIAGLVTFPGIAIVRETLWNWPLGLGNNPYFLPAHALQLYLLTPLATLAACVFLLGPGLIVAAVWGRDKTLATWLLSALGWAIVLNVTGISLFQLATGHVVRGQDFALLMAFLNVSCLVAGALWLGAGAEFKLRFDETDRGDLIGALVLFWLCICLFAPKFYWENFTGDGSGSLQFARLHIARLWPFWPPEAGPIRNAPGLTMVLFVFPESWFVRLWGEWEYSVRAPLLMYLALLYPVLCRLIRSGRETGLPAIDHVALVAALLIYTLSVVYSGGYHVYFGDSPMPAARETLAVVVFLGYVLAFVENRPGLMVATGIMTHLVIPTGGLWLVLWPVAAMLTWRPVPWQRLGTALGTLALAAAISVLAPRLIAALGLPFPGDEFGASNIIDRLRFFTAFDFWKIGFWIVPVGIVPALFLLLWPWQDRLARSLTLVSVAFFLFFYFQAWRVLLHHFIPAMIPPLIVMWRSDLFARKGWAAPLRVLVFAGLLLSLYLSWPKEMRLHGFERDIGQQIVTEGPIFETAQRADGERFRGFSIQAVDVAHVLLAELFPITYGEDDPAQRFYGAPLVWWFYSEFPKPEGQQINYVLKPLERATPADGEPIATHLGYGMFVLNPKAWRQTAANPPPVDTGAAIYETPRSIIYGHGRRLSGDRRVHDLIHLARRILGI